MKSFLTWLALAPVAVVLLVFAVVNRRPVPIIFDPFGDPTSGLSVAAPLFVELFVAAFVGVVLGGVATWFGQGRYRRAAREARAETARLRAENERLRIPVASIPWENRPAA
jgi:uncharacterized integral membrane protein